MGKKVEQMLSRRRFLEIAAATGATLTVFGAAPENIFANKQAQHKKKVLILGIDGMDPGLLRKYMDAGLMPYFKRFIDKGDFKPLQTSIPPQSPVAWSNFITGMDAGGHGIFDFVHRDPKTMQPYLSMSQATKATRKIELGSWVFPLDGGEVKQLRKGKAFWQVLEEHGIPTTIYKIPANFPPAPSKGKSLSGMGTPDIVGSPGTFSYFTTRVPSHADDISGGKVFKVKVKDNRVEAELTGPKNDFRRFLKDSAKTENDSEQAPEYFAPDSKIGFTVFLDPQRPVAKFVAQDNEFVLKEGEWSDWIPLEFKFVPGLVSVDAVCRFFFKQARPDFKLYVTPLQISSKDPAMPISTPPDWAGELCSELGHFYTQGLPEDSKALSEGILTGREFWQQAQLVYKERRQALEYLLDQFNEGVLFFYFSSLDQGCHMLWRYMDKEHPAFDSSDKLENSIRTLYQEMDESLGCALDRVDQHTTVIVMSDHGFAPFYWAVNLNSWLAREGYVKLKRPLLQGKFKYFLNVDWDQTKAYGLGINGLYVNLNGREKNGIVEPGEEYETLLDNLEKDLLAMRDPSTGAHPISQVVRCRRDMQNLNLEDGPDIIVGYNKGYRCSWESPLGEFPRDVFVENKDAWSADHCIDSRLVPGILAVNRKIDMDAPALYDITATVLAEYGIDPLPDMIGRNCLA